HNGSGNDALILLREPEHTLAESISLLHGEHEPILPGSVCCSGSRKFAARYALQRAPGVSQHSSRLRALRYPVAGSQDPSQPLRDKTSSAIAVTERPDVSTTSSSMG